MEEKGIIHVFGGKNNCSIQTQIADSIIKSTIICFKEKQMSKRASRKYKERKKRLNTTMNVNASDYKLTEIKLSEN